MVSECRDCATSGPWSPPRGKRRGRSGGRLDGYRRPFAEQFAAVGGEHGYHLSEDLGIRRDHLPAVQIVAFAGQVTDETARFLDQKASCRDIPRVQTHFPEAVVEAGG